MKFWNRSVNSFQNRRSVQIIVANESSESHQSYRKCIHFSVIKMWWEWVRVIFKSESDTHKKKQQTIFSLKEIFTICICFSYQIKCVRKLAHNRARTMELYTHEENRNCYGSLAVTFHTVRAGKSRIKSRFTSIKCFVCYF